VAEELGIAPSTFTEHLTAAQSKLLDAVLEAEPGTRARGG
jgi:predicted DNA binding protein